MVQTQYFVGLKAWRLTDCYLCCSLHRFSIVKTLFRLSTDFLLRAVFEELGETPFRGYLNLV